jgi:hypothetical protein
LRLGSTQGKRGRSPKWRMGASPGLIVATGLTSVAGRFLYITARGAHEEELRVRRRDVGTVGLSPGHAKSLEVFLEVSECWTVHGAHRGIYLWQEPSPHKPRPQPNPPEAGMPPVPLALWYPSELPRLRLGSLTFLSEKQRGKLTALALAATCPSKASPAPSPQAAGPNPKPPPPTTTS